MSVVTRPKPAQRPMLEIHDLVMASPLPGAARAADGVSVSVIVEPGEFFTLLGPSPSGKTALLRGIAGLDAPVSGSIALDGMQLFSAPANCNVPAEKRDVAMLMQTNGAWPRATVAENVALALEDRGFANAVVRAKVTQALARVGLGQLADRQAARLSAGEQQRVGLARAIAKEAKLLLLDEPWSNLDLRLREDIRGELRALGTTALCATHDQEAALAFSGRVAIMRAGRIVEAGRPLDLYLRPRHSFTARFLGHAVLIEGRRVAGMGEGVLVETDIGSFVAAQAAHDGPKGYLMIRPEFIEMAGREVSASNLVDGTVRAAVFGGKFVDYFVEAGQRNIRVQRPATRLYTEGEPVRLRFPAERCAFLPLDE